MSSQEGGGGSILAELVARIDYLSGFVAIAEMKPEWRLERAESDPFISALQ
jgi:hypothetical protein